MGVEVRMDSLLPALTRKKFQRPSGKLFVWQPASPRGDKSEHRSKVSVGVLSYFFFLNVYWWKRKETEFHVEREAVKFCKWKCRDSCQVCSCGHVSRWGEKNTPNQYSWTMYTGFVLNIVFKTHTDMLTWILDAKVWRQSDKSVKSSSSCHLPVAVVGWVWFFFFFTPAPRTNHTTTTNRGYRVT